LLYILAQVVQAGIRIDYMHIKLAPVRQLLFIYQVLPLYPQLPKPPF